MSDQTEPDRTARAVRAVCDGPFAALGFRFTAAHTIVDADAPAVMVVYEAGVDAFGAAFPGLLPTWDDPAEYTARKYDLIVQGDAATRAFTCTVEGDSLATVAEALGAPDRPDDSTASDALQVIAAEVTRLSAWDRARNAD